MTAQTKAQKAAANHKWYNRVKNTEEYQARRRAYRQAHPEKNRAAQKRKKAKNPEAWRIYHNAAAKKWAKQNRAKCRAQELKRTYGLTPEDITALLAKQNNHCLLCERQFGIALKHNVDHCHRTKVVRGLLCASCNMRLGVFEGLDASWVQRAETYLGGSK